MANKNHSPGGGKTNCASVEEILPNSLRNTTGSFQSEPQNLKVTPELDHYWRTGLHKNWQPDICLPGKSCSTTALAPSTSPKLCCVFTGPRYLNPLAFRVLSEPLLSSPLLRALQLWASPVSLRESCLPKPFARHRGPGCRAGTQIWDISERHLLEFRLLSNLHSFSVYSHAWIQ